MAEMHDIELEVPGELETVEADIQQEVEPQEVQQTTQEDSDIPPQFRGKSLGDIAKYALATERRLSKQGAELGEVRRLADELLKAQLMAAKPASEPEPEVDFFENPQAAVQRMVESNPRVIAAERTAAMIQQAQARQQLAMQHPDFQQIVHSDDFANWVRSSKVRSQLFQQAEQFDLDAAHELLDTYKTLRGIKAPQAQAAPKVPEGEAPAREAMLKAATVDTGGSGESGKKTYRRADLIRLRMREPERYDAMANEIAAAYREGRVR